MKRYCVTYELTIAYDVDVKANSKEEARAKVLEIIGDADNVKVWELKHATV